MGLSRFSFQLQTAAIIGLYLYLNHSFFQDNLAHNRTPYQPDPPVQGATRHDSQPRSPK